MKAMIVSALVVLTSLSAIAQYGGPRHGGYYGGYHGGGRADDNEVASILSSYSGMLLMTSASMCNSGPGCAYKEIIVESKDDAAVFLATDGETKGVKLTRALEILRQMDTKTQSTDLELAESILNY